MKKIAVLILTIIVIIATIWVFFNHSKYEIMNVDGVIMKPMELKGTWNDDLNLSSEELWENGI